MNNLILSLKDYKYLICLDTETTGLSPKDNEIIELAYVIYENQNGNFKELARVDDLLKLEKINSLPEEIINLTHITDEMLKNEGIFKKDSAIKFMNYLNKDGKILFAAYNAKFDKDFVSYFLAHEHKMNHLDLKNLKLDFLDILTIYKDRAPYPTKLETAIIHYHLEDKVSNTHRAIDDALACASVLFSMANEKDDIKEYINLFGYNPKYNVVKRLNDPIKYKPQDFISDYEYNKNGIQNRIPLYKK